MMPKLLNIRILAAFVALAWGPACTTLTRGPHQMTDPALLAASPPPTFTPKEYLATLSRHAKGVSILPFVQRYNELSVREEAFREGWDEPRVRKEIAELNTPLKKKLCFAITAEGDEKEEATIRYYRFAVIDAEEANAYPLQLVGNAMGPLEENRVGGGGIYQIGDTIYQVPVSSYKWYMGAGNFCTASNTLDPSKGFSIAVLSRVNRDTRPFDVAWVVDKNLMTRYNAPSNTTLDSTKRVAYDHQRQDRLDALMRKAYPDVKLSE